MNGTGNRTEGVERNREKNGSFLRTLFEISSYYGLAVKSQQQREKYTAPRVQNTRKQDTGQATLISCRSFKRAAAFVEK